MPFTIEGLCHKIQLMQTKNILTNFNYVLGSFRSKIQIIVTSHNMEVEEMKK